MRIKLDIPLQIQEIEKAIASLPSKYNKTVEFLVTDTREAEEGDLFFALSGAKSSGEQYIDEAIKKGAIPVTTTIKKEGLHVKDTRDALLDLSSYYLTKLDKLRERVCITGSVGKTTTKEFLTKISSSEYKTHSTIKNFNNDIGVPLSILSAPRDTEILILELGTNRHGEISRLSMAVKPTLGIITNIGTAHLGQFGSKNLIAKEKACIADGMQDKSRILVEYGEGLFDGIIHGQTVSTDSRSADYYLFPIKEDINGFEFDFLSNEVMLSNVRFNLPGRHILSCLAFSISASLILGVKSENIIASVSSLNTNYVRHKLIKMNGFAILDDSYNASRESVLADFKFLQFYKSYPISALLGDILELGEDTERIHREIGAMAYKFGLCKLYLYGSYSVFTAAGAKEAGMPEQNIFTNTDTENPDKTAKDIIENHSENEIILFKASHKLNLPKIIDTIKSKGRTDQNA